MLPSRQFNLEDWAGLADLCDPVSLRAFKREMLEDFPDPDNAYEETRDVQFDEEEDPEIRAAVEHDIAILREEWFEPAIRLKEQFSVDSLDKLREMDAGKMFARWLQVKKSRRDREASEDWKRRKTRESYKTTRAYRCTTLGHVLDGDRVAYVVYRNSNTPNDI